MVNDGVRPCLICGKSFEHKKRGTTGACKECWVKSYRKRYYISNRDKILNRANKWNNLHKK